MARDYGQCRFLTLHDMFDALWLHTGGLYDSHQDIMRYALPQRPVTAIFLVAVS